MNTVLQAYPSHWIDHWQLADGARLTVRPVRPQDQELEHRFVALGMTAQSRYQRFHHGLRELPEAVARYLTDIDYAQHFALVVEHFGPLGHAQVADARFVRDPQHPDRSEFALAVADAWQGRGLGRRLLGLLLQAARQQGQQLLYGDVMRDNHAMLDLARSMGFHRGMHPDDARLLRLHLPLTPVTLAPPPTAPRTPHPAGGPAAGPRHRRSPAACG